MEEIDIKIVPSQTVSHSIASYINCFTHLFCIFFIEATPE
jgi:hypothetical protein